ncbi:leucine-rich repeat-containing protein 1-like [Agrilus planipennis]|uniref:Leucine-rich repeat-containing protein 1-like n=1 Tax=Agrilus planipennis TaxID=224129 RepID=A0A1W4WRS0_AGRPL|nr:leucine-rich repeat-containing protein 1-like [Agrilus planipennis]
MSWLNCLSRKNPEFDDVKVLDYSRSALTEVPAAVFNFERTLDCLYLDGNKICDLPRTLFQCEELRYLNLSDNEIHVIPPLIVKLSNLQHLDLSRNYLKHISIPANIHRCQKLTVLDLSSNNLEKIPECLTCLVSLQKLFLNDTSIDFFPATIGRLNNLHILELRDNMLSMLPKSLKRLTSLQRLDLSNNDFCELPEVIHTLTSLTELWVNGNCMKVLQPDVGNLRKLMYFDGSNNEIESIPKEICFWSNITYLALSENLLKEIPPEICKLRQLETLKLDHNYLQSLPENIGNLKNLEDLDVRFNNLKSLPSSIGMLRKLNCLIASNNYITYLPPEIGSCSGLRILNLDVNFIVQLPQEIGHIQNLVSVSLVNNQLQFLPITVLKLSKLRALWLSQNQNQPLISLQKERMDNGQMVLTCIFLPQAVASPVHNTQLVYPSPNRRKICFTEPGVQKEFAPHLTRAPTPYPKDYQRYRKSVANILKKQKDVDHTNLRDLNAPVVKEAVVASAKVSDEDNQYNLIVSPPESNNSEQIYSKKMFNDNYYKYGRNTDVEDSGIEDKVNKNDTPSIEIAINNDEQSSNNRASEKDDCDNHNCYENSRVMFADESNLTNYNTKRNVHIPELKSSPPKDQLINISTSQTDQNQNFSNSATVYNTEKVVEQSSSKTYHDDKLSYENISSINRPLQIYGHETPTNTPKCENRLPEPPFQIADYSLRKEIKPPPYHIAAAYSKNAHFFNDIAKQFPGAIVKHQTIEEKPKHFTQDQPSNIIMPQPQHPLRLTQDEGNSRIDNLSFPESNLNNEGSQINKSNLDQLNENICNEATEKENLNSKLGSETVWNDNKSYKSATEYSDKNNQLQGWIFGKHRNKRILECPVTPTQHLGFEYAASNEGLFVTNVIDKYNKGSIMVGDKILMVDDFDLTMYPVSNSAKYLTEAGPGAEKFLVSRE